MGLDWNALVAMKGQQHDMTTNQQIGDHLRRIENKLDRVLRGQGIITDNQQTMYEGDLKMAGELDDLTAAVEADREVDDAAITLMTGLADKLDAAIAAGNPAAIKALSTSIRAQSQKMADAIVANTPADPSANP